MFTLVLKGHLALSAARFPHGATGENLDVLARMPLWEHGLDYNHGTGHGVGYILSVHEGPQSFRWHSLDGRRYPLEEGMVISNEPGYYEAGKFGIRHENLVLVRTGDKTEFGQFMYLEPLTMAPFDRDAIDTSLLTEGELAQLNDYHRQVYATVSPLLAFCLIWNRSRFSTTLKSCVPCPMAAATPSSSATCAHPLPGSWG